MASILQPVSQSRQPFAELSGARLQKLSSSKNCQNALANIMTSAGKDNKSFTFQVKSPLSTPSKRQFSQYASDDENSDAENIDPGTGPSKRTKNLEGNPIITSEKKKSQPLLSSPVTPRTAQVPFESAKSPSSASMGYLLNPRRLGYNRIDPRSSKNKTSGLGYSLDAALRGTISSKANNLSNPKSSKVTNLRKSMPTGWFFNIHEDTPEEEAAITMEHSCCTLDISSDDEAGPSSKKDARGKENIPPADVPSTNAMAHTSLKRRSINVDAMTDGEERSPLGSLPAEDFYAQGLDKDSVHLVTDGETTTGELRVEDPSARSANEENVNPNESATALPSSTSTIDVDKPDFVIAED